jgi:hypothetical protein
MKTTPETRPSNVTPFVLEGHWALDRIDRPTMRWLSRTAKRNRVGVADVIYEVLEAFVAKCEAEADLEMKLIQFPTSMRVAYDTAKKERTGGAR